MGMGLHYSPFLLLIVHEAIKTDVADGYVIVASSLCLY